MVILGAASIARAQDPADARRAVLALDDRANAAWLYGLHTLDERYQGPSMGESVRALGHGARLIEASRQAASALRAAGSTDPADNLIDSANLLAETLCPDLSDESRERILRRSEHHRLATECATTSDLITAVRDYTSDVRSVLADMSTTNDCELARRVEAARVRSAIEEVQASIATSLSVNLPDERRQMIAELRDVPATASRLAREPGTDSVPPAEAFTHLFPEPQIQRYRTAVTALSSTDVATRRRAASEVASAARALLSAPNPMDIELRSLRHSERALEQALAAWRSGASEPTMSHRLAAARGSDDANDLVDALLPQLASVRDRCGRE